MTTRRHVLQTAVAIPLSAVAGLGLEGIELKAKVQKAKPEIVPLFEVYQCATLRRCGTCQKVFGKTAYGPNAVKESQSGFVCPSGCPSEPKGQVFPKS